MFVSQTRHETSGRVRIYVSAMATELSAGKWTPFDQLIRVSREGEGYRVVFTHPGSKVADEWILVAPKTAKDTELLKRAAFGHRLDWGHFGPEMYVEDLGADILDWSITWSSGIVYDSRRDVLVREAVPDTGLRLDRWKRVLGDNLTLDLKNGTASMNLESVRARLEEAKLTDGEPTEADTVLDLDPETVIVALDNSEYYIADPASTDWDPVHDLGSATGMNSPGIWAVVIKGSCNTAITRSIVQFDTSGLATPTKAHLRLYRSGASADDVRLIGGDMLDLGSNVNYLRIRVRAAAWTIGGSFTELSGVDANWIRSPDITAPAMAAGFSAWRAEATFKLGLMEYAHDYLDDGVTGYPISEIYIYDHDGSNAAFLELLYYPSGSPLSPSPTVMRGGPF